MNANATHSHPGAVEIAVTVSANAPKRPTVYQASALLHFGTIAEITHNNPGKGPDGGTPSAS